MFFVGATKHLKIEITLKNTDTYQEQISCNFFWGSDVNISKFAVSKRPSHGIAGVNNESYSSGFAYKPSSTFVGKDYFEISASVYGNVDHVVKIEINANVIK